MPNSEVPQDEWRGRAMCRDLPVELFFPGDGDRAGSDAAKTICAGCPVRRDCLEDALATGVREGVRGGLGEHSRRALRSARKGPRKRRPVTRPPRGPRAGPAQRRIA